MFKHKVSFCLSRPDGLRFCILTTNEDARAFRPDRLVVRVPFRDCEDLSGPVYDRLLIVLLYDEGTSQN